ncbi:hypothetical protein IEN85_14630 [Pelagicoccus sp. NFK12]|uniref:Cell division protein FtsL n=1 Tax=Pelagicoccus enzymogenes TaxID=2773457 RepID=A0A927IIG2_9BACT|nr:hypothetical protein [Pelagicoccus enzymogenes]MBD5780733.1 hypothetical protein [Pelagicoccus enzymogenes]
MSNRKTQKPSQTSSILNRIIWLTFALTLFVGMFGLGTVYLRHEAAVLANENKALYANISEQKRHIAELGAVIARQTTRDQLKALNQEYGLGLRLPTERQIVHVLEDPTKRLYEKQSNTMLTAASF